MKEPHQVLVKGFKPTILAGFEGEVSSRDYLRSLIKVRRVIAVSGSAMSKESCLEPSDYGTFTQRSHIPNSEGVAQALMDLYKARFDKNGEETVFLTGSMSYDNKVLSFDVIVALKFHKLLKEYAIQREAQGLSAPTYKEAFINISDRNSRAKEVRWRQMPEGTGMDFVIDVEKNDISNNAKEMLILGVAEQLIVVGGGETVCRNLIRAKLIGLEVIAAAFSNSKVGVSGATHTISDFKKS